MEHILYKSENIKVAVRLSFGEWELAVTAINFNNVFIEYNGEMVEMSGAVSVFLLKTPEDLGKLLMGLSKVNVYKKLNTPPVFS